MNRLDELENEHRRLCREAEAKLRHFDALEAALTKLANEVMASAGVAPEGMIELVGTTNFNVLMLRVDEARAVLNAIDKERGK